MRPFYPAAFFSATVVLIANPLHADEYHYTNILIGDRAAGIGGAYTAISDDPSGLYYNPAGIAYTRGSNLSASVNAYHSTSTTYEGALGGKRDWTRDSSSLLPNFFGVVQPVGEGVFGFSYAVPDSIVEDQDQNFGDFEAQYGTVTQYTINFNQNDVTYKFGPSYARSLSDNLSVGLTLYYHYRDKQRIQNEYVVIDNAGGGGYEWTNRYVESSEHGVQPVLGFMWSATERLALGLTLTRNYLFDSETTTQSTYHIDANLEGVGLVESLNPPTSSSHQDEREFPLQVRLGAAWFHSPRLLLSADVAHYTAHDYRFGDDTEERDAVTNFAFGVEFYPVNTWALRGGLYTSYANTPDIDDSRTNQDEHVDFMGFTGSVTRYSRNSSLTFGVGYAVGSGEAQLFADTTGHQEVDAESLTFSLSSSYAF